MNSKKIILVAGLVCFLACIPGFAQSGCTCDAGCSSISSISANFTKNGSGVFCWKISCIGTYINSWNLTRLEINGVDFTNRWVSASNLPGKIDGVYYIYYKGEYAWSHFEAIGSCSGSTPMPTPGTTPTPATTPTLTPTPTPIGQTYTITSSYNGSGGYISPLGETVVEEGSSLTFTISPNGLHDHYVAVDGVNLGKIYKYTFENITDDHTIYAAFWYSPPTSTTTTTSASNGG